MYVYIKLSIFLVMRVIYQVLFECQSAINLIRFQISVWEPGARLF